jgi:hypothetical protein
MAEVQPGSTAPATALPNARYMIIHDIPLAYTTSTQPGVTWTKTSPFGNPFVPPATVGQTSTTELGERIIYADNRIWFTQGGEYLCNNTPPDGTPLCGWNHSRIVSFDPNATDDPATAQDERFCAYSVPGDDNEVVGLAWDGKRMWFTEWGSGAVGWFDPTQLSCDTNLNYAQADSSNPLYVAGQHQYCSATVTTNCVHTIPNCAFAAAGQACVPEPVNHGLAELTADPNGHTVWFTTLVASDLTQIDYNPNDPTDTSALRVTNHVSPPPVGNSPFTGNWEVVADSNYVYYTEFFTGDIARYNKTTGQTDVIHPPALTPDATTYALAIYNGRLYFTTPSSLGNDGGFGYVDLTNWNAGKPTGVLYTGLGSLTDASRAQAAGISPSGIAIDPSTGNVAIADFLRAQVLLLRH